MFNFIIFIIFLNDALFRKKIMLNLIKKCKFYLLSCIARISLFLFFLSKQIRLKMKDDLSLEFMLASQEIS